MTIYFPRYDFNGGKLQVQLPILQITHYGIPKFNPQWHKSDTDRQYIRLPIFDKDVIKMFNNIDDQAKKCLKKDKKFSFIETVRTSEEEDRPQLIKLKFDSDFNTGDIKTKFYTTDENNEKHEIENIKTMSDIEGIIKYKSKLKCVITVSKVWAQKKSANPQYGITWKLTHAILDNSEVSEARASNDCALFLDDDDDNENDTREYIGAP
jgi:hypothetical protein